MAFVAFPEPPELKVRYEDMITDSKPKSFGYTVENPHPGYGKDPNILNEYGHTKYPMLIGDKIANNEEEEKAIRNPSSVPEVKQAENQVAEITKTWPNNNPWPSAK